MSADAAGREAVGAGKGPGPHPDLNPDLSPDRDPGLNPDRDPDLVPDPDSLELAPGARHENLEGWVPALASEQEVREALEKAFDYRGDVTLTLRSGETVEAYVFDRQPGATLAESFVRLIAAATGERRRVAYADIARLEFSGRDRAAGRHWEDWVRRYHEKKAAGETNIRLDPEALD